jgi:CspA family cold shock protein
MSSQGTVKFFNTAKGFGFITMPDGQEIFAHFSNIQSTSDFKGLAEGQAVSFNLEQGPKGMQATNICDPQGNPVDPPPRPAKGAGKGGFSGGFPQQGGYGAPQQGGYGGFPQQGYGAPQQGYGAPQQQFY